MIFLHKNKNYKWPLFISVAIFFILFFSVVAFLFSFENKYENRVYPNTKIANVDIGGLTINQAKKVLNQELDKVKETGFKFNYKENEATLYPLISSLESDMAYEIITFKTDEAIKTAYYLGRRGPFLKTLKDKWSLYRHGLNFPVSVTLNQESFLKFLNDNFSEYSKPAQDARISYDYVSQTRPVNFSVEEESLGEKINFEDSLKKLKNNLSFLRNETINLSTKIDRPTILKENCLNIPSKANKFLEAIPITLKYKDKEWTINKTQAIEWLVLKNSPLNEKEVIIGLDFDLVDDYLIDTIAPDVNQEPVDAKFEVKDGKVVEFQDSKDGLTLDIVKSFKNIETALNQDKEEAELIVRELKSQLNTSSINDFGIREIIGTGHSSFAGSPKNRRHNISTGAAAVNGSLIKPGDEFSLIETLGDIDKESGYLPELVIKGNRTIPEYGGGLCQIGTTLFRATTGSGMPITMRRNHSYRVSYYEPAGTDATIYDPWPDYRFVNDSKYHILIQSRIEGDDLYFDFWSTEDGRLSTSTYPTIYNITRPGPTKIIETLDLEPGQKKCTEHAHNGADAYFDYTITYTKDILPQEIKNEIEGDVTDEDLIQKTRFSSHYTPWREVCLLGVEELSTSTEEVL